MARRFRVIRPLRYGDQICPVGEIVSEASLADTGREIGAFRRLLSGRSRGQQKQRGGALILFRWNDGFRVAEFGRDLEAFTDKGWKS